VSTDNAGSIHDARSRAANELISKCNRKRRYFAFPKRRIGGTEVKPLIVADPAYKLTTWCMNLFPQTRALTDIQRVFDKSLNSARILIQQVFGLLKGGLLVKLDESVEKKFYTIIICCILPNICLDVNDATETDVAKDDDGFFSEYPSHVMMLMQMVLE